MMSKWQTKNLGDVCRFIDYRGKTPEKIDSGLRLITAKNVKMGFLQREPLEYVAPESYDSWMTRGIPQKGDVLFTTEAPLANVAQLDTDDKVVFAQRIIILQPKVHNLDRTFLKYSLLSDSIQNRILKKGTGATVQGIKASLLKGIEIVFPPLSEQKRIVTILDEAFDSIATAKANAEKNLKNARALFESHLQAVFTQRGEGWVEKTIKEITSHLGDGLHGTPQYTDDGEYYFINGNNLDDGKIVFKENTKRVSVTEYEKYKKKLTDRTVLVSINGTLGNVAFYNDEKIILGKSACYFNILDNVDKHFIKYIISSPYFIEYAHSEATGATIKNVSLKSMREFKVPLPPLTEQNTIVRKLDSLSEETQRLESIYQQKLAALDALKKSLLDQAFRGKL